LTAGFYRSFLRISYDLFGKMGGIFAIVGEEKMVKNGKIMQKMFKKS
jgi:hypothetical protein